MQKGDSNLSGNVIGQRIKQAREEYGESRAALAAAIEVSEAAIKHWEAGRRRPADVPLLRIALRYHKSPFWLAGLTDDPNFQLPLSPEWKETIEEAAARGLTPEDVLMLIRVATTPRQPK